MRSLLLALTGLLTVPACNKGDAFTVVTVSSTTMLNAVARLHVRAAIGGATSQFDVRGGTDAGATFSIPPERTFGLQVPATYSGTLTLHIDAYDAADALLLSGDGQTNIAPGERSNAEVVLGGAPPSADLSGVDLYGAPPADLSGVDLNGVAQPDLTGGHLTLEFTSAGNTGVSTNPQGVAVGDFNADGKPDLVVASYTGGNMSVLLGDGTGALSLAGNFPSGGTGQGVAIADMNGDGKQDVVAATLGMNVAVLYGDGTGRLGTANSISLASGNVSSTAVALGSLNGDAIPDIVVAAVNNTAVSKVAAIVNNPAGTYLTPTYQPAGSQPSAIALADVNGDGRLDALEINATSSSLSVYLGNGDGTLGMATSFGTNGMPDWLTIADFNGDGKPDVAVSSTQGVEVFTGVGNGSFMGPMVSPAGSQAHGGAAADFDLDGQMDVVVTNYLTAGGVSVLLGMGNGKFQTPKSVTTGQYPLRVAAADLNRDGKPDIAVANASDNNVTVLLNTSH